MNKKELENEIAKSAGLSKADASRALQGTLQAITKSLSKGNKVSLMGFGTFSVNNRAARTGRNPQTGKAIQIPAKKVAKFKVGKKLAEAVN